MRCAGSGCPSCAAAGRELRPALYATNSRGTYPAPTPSSHRPFDNMDSGAVASASIRPADLGHGLVIEAVSGGGRSSAGCGTRGAVRCPWPLTRLHRRARGHCTGLQPETVSRCWQARWRSTRGEAREGRASGSCSPCSRRLAQCGIPGSAGATARKRPSAPVGPGVLRRTGAGRCRRWCWARARGRSRPPLREGSSPRCRPTPGRPSTT